MSDPTLIRVLAGTDLRRADTLRDERNARHSHKVEEFLRGLPGWIPPQREQDQAIARFADAAGKIAHALQAEDDATVAQRFHDELARLKSGATAATINDADSLVAVFACVGEASRRRLGMWPHPVQFAGARVLLNGRLAEMRTGEGKTLVAALAATVMAGSGAFVHVVSTNDYLVQRDCEEMNPLFEFFSLSGGFVIGGMEPDDRRLAYRHKICYVSGKELVFDYLKDRLAGHGALPARVSQLHQLWGGTAEQAVEPLIPALHVAIVDEADSVLIDEARTPMIIARETPGLYEPELLNWAIAAARDLQDGAHYRIREGRDVELLPGAIDHCPAVPSTVRPAWRSAAWREMLLRQALTALHLFIRDQHYILADGKVQIVDESTGRVMADRSWEQGLHQLIEAKEELEFTQGRETLARMTFQRFFRRYYLLSGLTGTAAEAARELWSVYRLKVRRVPPNRPNQHTRLTDQCYAQANEKWRAVADDAAAAAARGQPVLVGTRSVEGSEQIAAELTLRGIEHVVLNARQDAEEAQIIAQAGHPGRITVATNMAGRGTDIKLTDTARDAGGLHVILTEFHESPRIDRQLFGRSGRQGDRGSMRAIVCTQDDLFTQQPEPLRRLLAASNGPTQQTLLRWMVRRAQTQAEHRAYRTRMQTLKQDKELHRLIGFAGNVT